MATRSSGGVRVRKVAESLGSSEPRSVLTRGRAGQVSGKAQRTFKATEAKNRFGAIMRIVDKSEPVFIERHGIARAVVLDIDSYAALVEKARGPDELKLAVLRSQFDELYAAMQTTKSRAGVDKLLSASAADLNAAAAARSKSRG